MAKQSTRRIGASLISPSKALYLKFAREALGLTSKVAIPPKREREVLERLLARHEGLEFAGLVDAATLERWVRLGHDEVWSVLDALSDDARLASDLADLVKDIYPDLAHRFRAINDKLRKEVEILEKAYSAVSDRKEEIERKYETWTAQIDTYINGQAGTLPQFAKGSPFEVIATWSRNAPNEKDREFGELLIDFLFSSAKDAARLDIDAGDPCPVSDQEAVILEHCSYFERLAASKVARDRWHALNGACRLMLIHEILKSTKSVSPEFRSGIAKAAKSAKRYIVQLLHAGDSKIIDDVLSRFEYGYRPSSLKEDIDRFVARHRRPAETLVSDMSEVSEDAGLQTWTDTAKEEDLTVVGTNPDWTSQLRCPICRSTIIRRKSMVHAQGISTTVGVGVVGGGLAIGAGHAQTALSRLAAPPSDTSNMVWILATVAAIAGAIVAALVAAVLGVSKENFQFWVASGAVFSGVLFSVYYWWSGETARDRAWRAREQEDYLRSWLCLACGHDWVQRDL